MSIITIVGAGMMGTAMAFPASDNGHEVRLVGTPLDRPHIEAAARTGVHPTLGRALPKNVKLYQTEELEAALAGADLLIGGVSSFGVAWFGSEVLPRIPERLPVLSVTKGLECRPDGTLVPIPAALLERSGRSLSLNAVGGPVISFELADRKQTSIAFCGSEPSVLEKLREMLETPYYHITLTTDVPGLECAVAMKNSYALGVALSIGLNEAENGEGCPESYNPQAALFTQSVRECMALIRLMGGEPESLPFFAGDLYVTVFGGRTRRIGMLLGRGLTFPEARERLAGVTLESVAIATLAAKALRILEARGVASLKDFPLLAHIDGILNRGIPAAPPWNAFAR